MRKKDCHNQKTRKFKGPEMVMGLAFPGHEKKVTSWVRSTKGSIVGSDFMMSLEVSSPGLVEHGKMFRLFFYKQ